MVCGSRVLFGSSVVLVGQVSALLLQAGRLLSVGCAAGADQAALGAAIKTGLVEQVSVYAVGGSCGSGFAGSASNVAGVHAAASMGARVNWWAGGQGGVPLRARLVSRSLACISSLGQDGVLVAFVSSMPGTWSGTGVWRSCGSGTWSSVLAAILQNITVVVVPVGQWSAPILPVPGQWEVAGQGIWASAFRFVPSQKTMFL